jgi:hypothetical protein
VLRGDEFAGATAAVYGAGGRIARIVIAVNAMGFYWRRLACLVTKRFGCDGSLGAAALGGALDALPPPSKTRLTDQVF